MAEITEAARTASVAARPELLKLLDSTRFRAFLRKCCAASGIAEWPAEHLLGTLHANIESAELVHNFENSHSGLSLEVLLRNATDYVPTSWQMIYLGYYGQRLAKFGHPASPADAAEEGIWRLQPFSQAHDLPGSYEEASARLQYVALNMLRVDTGNPNFGNVTAVISPSYWKDAIAGCPVDTGLWTWTCNETYRKTPGSIHIPVTPPLDCQRDPTPGVAGAMDHALLNNHLFWSKFNVLGNLFGRWYGSEESFTNVSSPLIMTYLETNVFANLLFEDHGIKLLVGAFAPLFGTPRGRLLQQLAEQRGIALAWALGDGRMSPERAGPNASNATPSWVPSWRSGARILDLVTAGAARLNVSVDASAQTTFEKFWKDVGAERGPAGDLSQAKAQALWARMEAELSTARLSVPAPGVCADWSKCVGALLHGRCVCYGSGPAAARSERLAGIFV